MKTAKEICLERKNHDRKLRKVHFKEVLEIVEKTMKFGDICLDEDDEYHWPLHCNKLTPAIIRYLKYLGYKIEETTYTKEYYVNKKDPIYWLGIKVRVEITSHIETKTYRKIKISACCD